MGVKAADLVAGVEAAYQEKGGYIWGASGELWTEAKQKAIQKTTDDNRKLSREKGSKWIGHHVWDCSGLPYDVLKKLGVKIAHGSNSIWKNNLSHKGKYVPGMKLPVGAAIFTGTEADRGHIGTLVTATCVNEAKGVINGIVHTPISNKKWTWWGLYKGVDYDFIPGEEEKPSATKTSAKTAKTATSIKKADTNAVETKVPSVFQTLRKSYRGSDVKYMQELLLEHGEKLPKYGADGQFGTETLRAVQSFQRKNGLEIDGVVGKQTWAALLGVK